MKVWVVKRGLMFERLTIHGVFSSRRLALKLVNKLIVKHNAEWPENLMEKVSPNTWANGPDRIHIFHYTVDKELI